MPKRPPSRPLRLRDVVAGAEAGAVGVDAGVAAVADVVALIQPTHHDMGSGLLLGPTI